MTHQPPVPAGNQSPYPLQEQPHAQAAEPPVGVAIARTPEKAERSARPWILGGIVAAGVATLGAVGAWAYATEPNYKRKERKRRKAR